MVKARVDVGMKDRSDKSSQGDWCLYEDLSGYENDHEAPAVAPPAAKTQAAPCSAARLAPLEPPHQTTTTWLRQW